MPEFKESSLESPLGITIRLEGRFPSFREESSSFGFGAWGTHLSLSLSLSLSLQRLSDRRLELRRLHVET